MSGAAPRLDYLDGLRGLAALQVVLLHYVSAFLPVVAMAGTVAWYPAGMAGWQAALARSPLVFLIDGYSAVYVFFLMSGFVLRRAFMRVATVGEGVSRRVVRLGLPTAAAVALAGLLLALDNAAHRKAAVMSGSTHWLGVLMDRPPAIGAVMRDALLNGTLLGYRETTAFPLVGHFVGLSSLSGAFDVPVWTLNIELAGSLICLGLSLIGRRSRALAIVAILLFGWRDGASQLFLFVIGFLLAGVYPRRCGRWAQGLAVGGMIGGILLCRLTAIGPVMGLRHMLRHQNPPDGFHFTNQLGAILIFVAVLNLPRLQDRLSRGVPHWLGRISFSLYLVHFPIMATLGCSVFVAAEPALGVIRAAGLALVVGLAVTLPVAVLFEQCVDRVAVRVSHKAGRWG